MTALLLAALLAAQAAPEAPPQEIERLRKENAELRQNIKDLEAQTLEDAAMLKRLRQALKAAESRVPPAGAAVEPPSPAPVESAGPDKPLRAKLDAVNPQYGFVVMAAGEAEGVKPGYRFEIVRETYEEGGPPRLVRIGEAEFEKYLGTGQSTSKLRVTQGNAAEMRIGDEAVAYRKIPPAPSPGAAAERPQDVYKVTGQAADGFVIDYGTVHGAKRTDVVYAYKDGSLKAKMRLDTVEKNFSVARIVDGSQVSPVEMDDMIYLHEIKKTMAGRVVLCDDKRGFIALDIREQEGAKVGQRYEVRRQGRPIGTVVVTVVEKWGSRAKPEVPTAFEDIQKGDFVEIVKED